jgi:ferredoxin/flavodoxin
MESTTYNKIVIYYFTGTGNSENVTHWVAETAEIKGIETEIINITSINRLHPTNIDSTALIIFVSPIHGFNYPPVMMHFIMRFPKGSNNVALMNTRAGMLIGKYITPGLTGIAFYFSALVLKLKGYSVKAMIPVDMPSNWISVHPGLNLRTVKYLHSKNKERVVAYTQKLITGKSCFKSVREIPLDLIISPIALLYYFFGRFFLSKTYYASSDCNNCGLCIRKCPVKAIKWVDNRPFWTFNCESCMHCMSHCPKLAIETAHGSIALIVVLFSSLIIGWFYYYFELFFFQIENQLVQLFFENLLFLGLLIIWYRFIHFLLRFRFFERIIVYTSLTKYKFWGRRYKALKNNLN